jgi:hypothetical protein
MTNLPLVEAAVKSQLCEDLISLIKLIVASYCQLNVCLRQELALPGNSSLCCFSRAIGNRLD